jgi:PAS domain S-box-containing protein
MPGPAQSAERIPWHQRIEAAVVAGSGLLVALSIGAVLVGTTRLVTSRALDRASIDIGAARAAFYDLIDRQAESGAALARLVTVLPVFRAHIDDPGDPGRDPRLAIDLPTIEAMAEDYRQQLRAEFSIVTSRRDEWVVSPGWPAHVEPPPAVRKLIASGLEGRPVHNLVLVGNRLFLVVTEPVRFAEETLGAFTVGFALDERFARGLAKVTRAEITFAANGHVVSSSAEADVRAAIAESLKTGADFLDPPGAGVTIRRLGAGTYVTSTSSLFSDRSSAGLGSIVVLQDWQPTQQFLDELRWRLALIGGGIFVMTLAAAMVFSRRLSQPLRDISDAARDIAAGNWNSEVPIRGRAEATTMARAFNDMTATVRHWYEEAREQSARLQTSYEQFRAVTESARDGIVSIDRQGQVAFWNRSAAQMFACSATAANGRRFAEFIDRADRATYLAAIAERGGPSPTIELTGVRQDGSTVPIELRLSPPVGDEFSVTAVVRDITDRKKAEAVLRQSEADLRQAQKLEAVGRLAGGVAHDFNNMLTAIHGFAELVYEKVADDPEQADNVNEILNAANRAAQLTRQLLAFSRRSVLAPRVISLDRLLFGTEKMMRRLIGEDIVLTCRADKGLGFVKADPGQVEQVFVNLAVNARDAMPGGGTLAMSLTNVDLDDKGALEFDGLLPGKYVQLEVVDNGEGMTEDTVSKIFEPFFTTKPEGKGTGLGLATVYGIVRQSGGAIDVQSRVGQGTRFRIVFPQSDEPPDDECGSHRMPGGVRSAVILLVEDDELVRRLLSTTLRQLGYTVLEASGSQNALALSRGTSGLIHLLVTDVVMPQMNGRRLAEIIVKERPTTRVLFMSGYSDDEVLRAGVRMRETPFIQKPFSADDLAAKVREALAD